MKRRVHHFSSEAEMCARYIDVATGKTSLYGRGFGGEGSSKATGWVAYPETAGWDILMVRSADGFQVGIQAKLRLNDDVILQTIEHHSSLSACCPGPDCRAVLVPYGTGSRLHHEFCRRVGIQIITVRDSNGEDGAYHATVSPDLPRQDFGWEYGGVWPQMLPTTRETLPPVVPDVVAGAPSPLQLTAWKVKAIKIASILERRGWVCRSDFKHIEIDHRRFLDSGWLALVDGAWRQGPAWPDFRRQHPVNFEQIDALYDRWKPAEPPAKAGRAA